MEEKKAMGGEGLSFLGEVLPEVRPYRWVMLGLLWLLYASFGLISRAIFPLVTPLLRDLALTYTQMGVVLGSWQLTYILAALAAGTVLDRWGVRRCLLAGAVLMSLSAGFRFFAVGFWSLLAAVAIFGAGGPMISIGGPKTIAAWFAGQGRGTAMGLYMAGPAVGGLLSLSLTNSLVMPCLGQSWRLTFVFYGLVALGAGGLWWFLSRETEGTGAGGEAGLGKIFGRLIRVRNVRLILLMALASFAVSHGFTSWLPKILEVSGLSPAKAGLAAAVPVATGALALVVIPRLVPASRRGRVIAVLALLTLIFLLVVSRASGGWLLLGLAGLGVTESALLPLMLLILMDSPEVGSRHMGAAGGMYFTVAEMGGFTGPLIMGLLVDATGAFLAGVGFLAGLCLAVSALTLLLRREGSSAAAGAENE